MILTEAWPTSGRASQGIDAADKPLIAAQQQWLSLTIPSLARSLVLRHYCGFLRGLKFGSLGAYRDLGESSVLQATLLFPSEGDHPIP
jgi:hypothetical protein